MFNHILDQIVLLWEQCPDEVFLKLSDETHTPKLIIEWQIDGVDHSKDYLIDRADGERLIAKLKRACNALERTGFLN